MANPWKKVDIGILTVIPVELDAVKRALGVPDESSPEPNPTRTLSYYFVKIVSIRDRRTYTIAIGVIGRAGNYTAGAAAGVCIQDCAPECMMLVGICAGVRGKIKIGEVALPEHVLAYEGGVAVQEADDTSTLRPRVTQTRRPDLTNQWVSVYASDKDARERARRRFHDQQGWEFPSAPAGKRSEFAQNVAGAITFSSDVTIASGEKLLRDATKLDVLRAKIHDKTIIGDMESAGFVEACNKHGKPWVIVRGVSDFGDAFKDDQFHRFAARSAAVVLYDFIVHGANIRGRARWITAAFVALASLVVGALFVSFA